MCEQGFVGHEGFSGNDFLHSVERSVDESENPTWDGANLRSLLKKAQVRGFLQESSHKWLPGKRCG